MNTPLLPRACLPQLACCKQGRPPGVSPPRLQSSSIYLHCQVLCIAKHGLCLVGANFTSPCFFCKGTTCRALPRRCSGGSLDPCSFSCLPHLGSLRLSYCVNGGLPCAELPFPSPAKRLLTFRANTKWLRKGAKGPIDLKFMQGYSVKYNNSENIGLMPARPPRGAPFMRSTSGCLAFPSHRLPQSNKGLWVM